MGSDGRGVHGKGKERKEGNGLPFTVLLNSMRVEFLHGPSRRGEEIKVLSFSTLPASCL